MIKPTVGRIVHFFREYGVEPMAAIIANVWSDTCVNLAVFDHFGRPWMEPPTSVLLVQPEAKPPADGAFCQWMPYQVKKTTGSESGEKEAGSETI